MVFIVITKLELTFLSSCIQCKQSKYTTYQNIFSSLSTQDDSLLETTNHTKENKFKRKF